MALADLFTDAQLEIAIGGADRLLQLSKAPTTASAVYTSFKTEVKAAAFGEVYSILKVAIDITDTTVPAAQAVQQYALSVGVYWAWWKGTGGQAVPDEVVRAHETAVAKLKEMVEGGRTLGTETDPATTIGHKMVSLESASATGTRILRKNMGGFC